MNSCREKYWSYFCRWHDCCIFSPCQEKYFCRWHDATDWKICLAPTSRLYQKCQSKYQRQFCTPIYSFMFWFLFSEFEKKKRSQHKKWPPIFVKCNFIWFYLTKEENRVFKRFTKSVSGMKSWQELNWKFRFDQNPIYPPEFSPPLFRQAFQNSHIYHFLKQSHVSLFKIVTCITF